MCLQSIRIPRGDELNGIGYKYVCATDTPGVYAPEWLYFYKNGEGGVGPVSYTHLTLPTKRIV